MVESKRPLVSIIISTFNNKITIEKCIRSIKNQMYSDIEIIVVDEWSKDGTDKIAESLGAKVYYHGKERANNRNLGIKKAKGIYYFFIDSDMEVQKTVVVDCLLAIEKGCDALVIPEKSVGSGYWAKVRAFERQFILGDDSVEAARFFKKDIIKAIGGYDPNIVGAEDWDLHQRTIEQKYKICRIKSYIIHNEGNLQLKRLLKKKIYYGKAFLEYKKRYPKAFKNSVLRKGIFFHIPDYIRNPKYGFGVIVLKLLEGSALFYGMFLASQGKNYKHY
jgi:glycosyltransferase involved in cell wall biosynthesis